MELTSLGDGTYEVRLGGVLWDNCTTDAQCPGRALCAINATWSAHPQMCYCYFTYGHTSASCENWTGIAWFFLVVSILCSFVMAMLFALGIYNTLVLYRLARLKWDAISTSLILAVLASLFGSMQCAASARFVPETVQPDAKGSKADNSPLGRILLAFVFFFGSLSFLNVSLVWIEISENASNMRRSNSQNISRYRTILILYYVIIFGLIIASFALGDYLLSAAGAIPGAAFVIITYMVGFFKMRRMVNEFLTASSDGSDKGVAPAVANSESGRKLRHSLQLIQISAIWVSLMSAVFVIGLVVWVSWGAFADVPGADVGLIPLTIAWMGFTGSITTVMTYLTLAIRKKTSAVVVGASADKSGALLVVRPSSGHISAPSPKAERRE